MTTVHEGNAKLLATEGDIYYHECPNTASAIIEVVGDFDGVLTVEGHALQVPYAKLTNTWGARNVNQSGVGFLGGNTITNDGTSIANEYQVLTGGQSLRIVATELNSGSALVRVTSSHNATQLQSGVSAVSVSRPESSVLFTEEQGTLADGAEINTGFIDCASVDKLQVTIRGDASGLTYMQTLKPSSAGDEATLAIPLSLADQTFTFPPRERFFRLQIQNNTGNVINNVVLQIKASYGSSDKTSVFPLSQNPVAQSQAQLNQSVLIGKDPNGVFQNTSVNQTGALLTSDFKTEVARGLYEGYSYGVKFGRVPDVDTGTTPEDIYNGGNEYTGFNATGNEEIAVESDDSNDVGSLIASGTATGGSNTTLIDTGADFVTSAVVVGDVVLNDSQGIHGVVTSVDSATQLTVFEMIDGIADTIVNVAGDSYRIARAISTGAGVLKLKSILDEDYVQQEDAYVILNGTTTITTSGVNAMRCPTGRIIIAGSSGRNEGEITVTQAVSTSNVFCVIPTFGTTTIGCFTVPAGKDCIITKIDRSITRTNGSAGSATIALNVRRFGQAFTSERVYELNTTGASPDETILTLPPATDIKGTVENVSDNNTVAEIRIEFFLVDR